ncbi:hypothetical protein V6N11_016818 [Hibiscus sabdariffa]|uniref:Uncharacterized protein n=1 Tax=Hibiscus sabdariffa TaxID=183260 RepID=A0ABR2TW75_9ROSI
MVHAIHDWAWAGTPNEDAAWLRLRRLADTWYRILLIPITGGVMVGMMHGLLEILYQIRQSSSPQQGFDLVAGVFPLIKAIQAAATLGTGSSLGPEGPSVDIGKSCANGFSLMMENNRERRIALVATGAASGIASECLITVALHSIPWLVLLPAVAGCFFAIETVLRHLRAENSPPFTTAMIILASVISSTGSSALLGTESAFPMPSYDLKSATGDIRQYLSEKQSMSPTVIQRILMDKLSGKLLGNCQGVDGGEGDKAIAGSETRRGAPPRKEGKNCWCSSLRINMELPQVCIYVSICYDMVYIPFVVDAEKR